MDFPKTKDIQPETDVGPAPQLSDAGRERMMGFSDDTVDSQDTQSSDSAVETLRDRDDIEAKDVVPVDQIDLSDSHVQSDADFKKVSHDQMVDGFGKLQDTVRPMVENESANADTFRAMDQQQGLEYQNGYLRVYEAFYRPDGCIKLDKVGDTYEVTNGYHRLHVANELGIKDVPARVAEVGDV